MTLTFSIIVGTTYQTANTGIWQAGNFFGTPAIGVIPISNRPLYITDIGFYADPYNTGIAPPWEMPDPAEEMRQCQRYWYRAYSLKGLVASTSVVGRVAMMHPVQMRVVPALAVAGALRMYDGITAVATTYNANASNVDVAELNMNASGLTIARAAISLRDSDDTYIAVSARM
jgi:hypothetical protein